LNKRTMSDFSQHKVCIATSEKTVPTGVPAEIPQQYTVVTDSLSLRKHVKPTSMPTSATAVNCIARERCNVLHSSLPTSTRKAVY
ncbi:hypothetical protein BaRGS_00001559, partial [Batillaria attramentaria]